MSEYSVKIWRTSDNAFLRTIAVADRDVESIAPVAVEQLKTAMDRMQEAREVLRAQKEVKKQREQAPPKQEEAVTNLQQARRASILLKHVSDPTRLQVILILAEGERHVGALCAQLGQSQPAVSHHLALLRHGGIIAPRRQGKNNFYSLTETGSDLARVVKNLIV